MYKNSKKLARKDLELWLLESDIRKSDGSVLSWLNEEKVGYVYNEIIGYYIKLLNYLNHISPKEKFRSLSDISTNYLLSQINDLGGVTRNDITYVFDSAMCASGILSTTNRRKLNSDEEKAVQNLCNFVCFSLSKENSAFTEDGLVLEEIDRWSLSYGSLHLKTIVSLHEAYLYFGDKKYLDSCLDNYHKLIQIYNSKGFFSINKEIDFVYTHPHCYATEGLLYFRQFDFPKAEELTQGSAKWLSNSQNPDGSMSNWYNNNKIESLDYQGDATSQAIRIWLAVDRKEYSNNISKAFQFLETLQSKSGGLFYNKGSKDINSWVSMFALQAIFWFEESPETEWII